MQLKHYGSLEELTAILKSIGATGRWVDGDPMEFFMNGGGKVRWWPSTHTVCVQGSPTILLHVTKCLAAALAAKAAANTVSPGTPAPAIVNVGKTGLPPVTTSKPDKDVASPKFFGRLSELKTRIAATTIQGTWKFESGAHTFLASTGAALKWFPKSGALSFQGPFEPRSAFRKLAIICLDWPARPVEPPQAAPASGQPLETEGVEPKVTEVADDPAN